MALLDLLSESVLVYRVVVGVQQRHRDRFNALLDQVVQHPGGRFEIQFLQNAAVAVDTFGHLGPEAPGNDRLREVGVEVVHVVDLLAPHLEHVSEALCR